jgi:hypothetical protein
VAHAFCPAMRDNSLSDCRSLGGQFEQPLVPSSIGLRRIDINTGSRIARLRATIRRDRSAHDRFVGANFAHEHFVAHSVQGGCAPVWGHENAAECARRRTPATWAFGLFPSEVGSSTGCGLSSRLQLGKRICPAGVPNTLLDIGSGRRQQSRCPSRPPKSSHVTVIRIPVSSSARYGRLSRHWLSGMGPNPADSITLVEQLGISRQLVPAIAGKAFMVEGGSHCVSIVWIARDRG